MSSLSIASAASKSRRLKGLDSGADPLYVRLRHPAKYPARVHSISEEGQTTGEDEMRPTCAVRLVSGAQINAARGH